MTVNRLIRLLLVGLLGAGAAVLVSCGSSGAGLIPSENAGPLVADFQAVEQAALKGGGNCAPTEAALRTTERDFQTLPASVNRGLRAKLRQGISHLHAQALELCTEPLASTTGESTSTTPAPSTTTAPTATTPTTPSAAGTTPPSSTTPGAGAEEGGTAPEGGGSSEGNGAEGGGEEESSGKEGGGGAGHEDSGLGNSGVSGNGGTGPGGH